jgi:hypothetical protein
MVDDRSPLLTSKQWEAMTAGENMKNADRRTHRSRGRSRLRGILRDFRLLFTDVDSEHWEDVFDPLDAYREQRRLRDEEHVEGEDLHEGIVSTLAFLYGGVGDKEEFARMLEQAIRDERESNNFVPISVNVSIEIGPDRDEFLTQWQSLSDEEKLATIDENPVLLFDKDLGVKASLFADEGDDE